MKRLIIFLLLFAAIKVAGQTTGYLRFDTVLIYKQGGTAELILRSSTKDSLGVLVNYSDGRTRFMKSRALNDSTIIIGLDTIVIRGATGGTSGGTGIGEVVGGYGLINVNDSTLRADTSGTNGLVTRSELIDSTDRETVVLKPIVAYEGATWETPDTLDILRGWGVALDADSALTVDSLLVTSRARTQHVADSLGALITAAGGTPTLQQVTDAGQVTNDSIKVRTVSIDSALYMAVRSASDSINFAQKAGLIVYDSVSGSFMYRNQNLWTFLSSLSNSLIPNRPNMRLIAGVFRPSVVSTTVTWNWIIDPLHDSVGFGTITCDGSSVNLFLSSEAAKIHTIVAVPDETLAQWIDVGISFLPDHAKVYIKRRKGVINGRFVGNGTTYVWTGSPGVTSTYNTANGQLNFDFISDFTPPSGGGSFIYVGPNGYRTKRLFVGLSGNDRGYQVTDMFGNGVVGAPTSDDVIEAVIGDQEIPVTINPCSAPGDGWAAYLFGGTFGNIWVIGLVEY